MVSLVSAQAGILETCWCVTSSTTLDLLLARSTIHHSPDESMAPIERIEAMLNGARQDLDALTNERIVIQNRINDLTNSLTRILEAQPAAQVVNSIYIYILLGMKFDYEWCV